MSAAHSIFDEPAGGLVVEEAIDPKNPCRTAYRITAPHSATVQTAITLLMWRVDVGGGYGEFTSPERARDGYISLGHIVMARPIGREARA